MKNKLMKQTTFREVLKKGVSVEEGVYLFYLNDSCLYIGQSGNLSNRLKSHIKLGDINSSFREKVIEEPTISEERLEEVTIKILPIKGKENRQKVEKILINQIQPLLNGKGRAYYNTMETKKGSLLLQNIPPFVRNNLSQQFKEELRTLPINQARERIIGLAKETLILIIRDLSPGQLVEVIECMEEINA